MKKKQNLKMEGLKTGARVECDFTYDSTRRDMWNARYPGVVRGCDSERGVLYVELDAFRAIFEVDAKAAMPEHGERCVKMPARGEHVEVLCRKDNEWGDAHVVARNIMGEETAVEVRWNGPWRGSQGAVVSISEMRTFVPLPENKVVAQ